VDAKMYPFRDLDHIAELGLAVAATKFGRTGAEEPERLPLWYQHTGPLRTKGMQAKLALWNQAPSLDKWPVLAAAVRAVAAMVRRQPVHGKTRAQQVRAKSHHPPFCASPLLVAALSCLGATLLAIARPNPSLSSAALGRWPSWWARARWSSPARTATRPLSALSSSRATMRPSRAAAR
jgi:hypothetical protein